MMKWLAPWFGTPKGDTLSSIILVLGLLFVVVAAFKLSMFMLVTGLTMVSISTIMFIIHCIVFFWGTKQYE